MKESLHRAAIWYSQFGFAVAQDIRIPQFSEQAATAGWRQEIVKQIFSEKLFPARTAQHLHERVICIYHPPVRVAKESSLLNAVEKVPVAPFRFHLFANVDEDMDRVRVRSVVRRHLRRGHQEAAIRQKFDWPFESTRLVRAQRAISGVFFAHRSKHFVNRAPDQLGGMNPEPRGQRSIDSNDISVRAVDDNRVRNRVNYPDPPLPGTMHLFKQASVVEQSAKTDAQECQPFQKFFREILRTLPLREGRTEA